MAATVSVLVPTFNRAAFLPMALDSLLRQSRPADEILVINDGSTDGTCRLLDRYRGRIRVLERPNGGKSEALNSGLAAASGDHVWFFDDDDAALPDALERHLAKLAERPEAGFTLSPGIMCDTEPGSLRMVPQRSQPVGPPFDPSTLLAYLLVAPPTPCFLQGGLVRRACVEAAGAFDPELLRGQDYAFLVQLARTCQVARIAEPTYLHRQGDHPRGPERLRHPAEERNRHWVRFGQLMWRKWQADLDLMDHLPRDAEGRRQTPTAERIRDARVARCAALYFKGLWDDLDQELGALSAGVPPATACGPFAAELWLNAVLRLRANLWAELADGPVWTRILGRLRSPSASCLGNLMLQALRHARRTAPPDLDPRSRDILARLIQDLECSRSGIP